MKTVTGVLLAAAFAGILGIAWYSAHVLGEVYHAQAAELDSLRHRAARVDSVFVHDTVRLTQWRTRFDTLQDTVLQHLTDTVKVREFVRVADSTIAACSAVVLTCEARVAARDSLIAVQAAVIDAEHAKDRLPLFHVKLPSRTASLGLGVALGFGASLLLGGHR